eukprot:354976_1
MIAGDYKAFDKSLPVEIMLQSFHHLIKIAERAGYSERQLTIMRGIATEISMPIYEYNGVLIQAPGSNPSGHPGTVVINDFSGQTFVRYGYYKTQCKKPPEEVPDFDKKVKLAVYGDDNAMGVCKSIPEFNHTT